MIKCETTVHITEPEGKFVLYLQQWFISEYSLIKQSALAKTVFGLGFFGQSKND